MNIPGVTELLALVRELETLAKGHMDVKLHGPHCLAHKGYTPDCVPCIEVAEGFIT